MSTAGIANRIGRCDRLVAVSVPVNPVLRTMAKLAPQLVPEKFAKFAKFAKFDPALAYPPLIRCQAQQSARAFLD